MAVRRLRADSAPPPLPLPRAARRAGAFEEDYAPEGAKLGAGSHGAVIAARCRRTGQRVAVKIISLAGLDEKAQEQMRREVQTARALDHPHIAKVLAVYETSMEIRLVSERMTGGELYDRLASHVTLPEHEAADAARQMLLALAHMHAHGLVHRDLKLDNVMFQRRGGSLLKLIDFGYSRSFEPGERMSTRVGTPSYVAPEVLARRYYSGSCDMWSLGVVVFSVLGGYLPFVGRSERQTLDLVRRGRYEMFPERWGAISAEAKDFVRRLLETDPARRPTAAEALAHPWLAAVAPAAQAAAAAKRLSGAVAAFAEASLHRQACLRRLARSRALPESDGNLALFGMLDEDHLGTVDFRAVRRLLGKRRDGPSGDKLRFVALALSGASRAPSPTAAGGESGRVSYSDFLALMHAAEFAEDDDDELMQAVVGRFAGQDLDESPMAPSCAASPTAPRELSEQSTAPSEGGSSSFTSVPSAEGLPEYALAVGQTLMCKHVEPAGAGSCLGLLVARAALSVILQCSGQSVCSVLPKRPIGRALRGQR